MTAVELEFRHVSRRYGDLVAVNDLSLTVPAGQICVLVGPSGCGKTTSLKMVNRLIEPTSGQILIGGDDVMTRDPIALRRGIGYVIQQVGLLPHLTVAENVAVVPRLLGWERPRIDARIDELLALTGLAPRTYRKRYPAQLSGGERQRVGVARALAADPPLMLMDEPFAAVDPLVRARLQNELLRLQEQLAKTILFVTHDIDEAIKMGDLVAVMQVGGVLAQFGPPAEVLANPASDFVARFVGADRGLKRLSLTRVADLTLQPAITAHPGDAAAEARARILADPFPYLLLVDPDGRPLGWLDQAHVRSSGTLTTDQAAPLSPLLNRRTTLKDALSQLLGADVMAGIVVDRHERVLGLVTVDQIAAALRGGALMQFAFDLDWVVGHLDDLAFRTGQHIFLTAIAVGIGLLISLGLAVVAVRRRATYGPILAVTDVLYTIPSLALFAVLVAITGISVLTVEIPLVMYTLVIFVRNIAAGLDAVPADVLEAANGLGYTRGQRLWRVELPLALPLVLAGTRLATVSTIGLVTVTSIMGDAFGGLGYFILEGYRRGFATELYFGALPSIVLALAADFLLARLQRTLTPWSAQRMGAA